MAEQRKSSHPQKLYKVWLSKEYSLWQKVKEFFIETSIMVFAVSISIWFNNWNEDNHEQKLVKTFLLGLKTDIQQDIKAIEQLQDTYHDYDF